MVLSLGRLLDRCWTCSMGRLTEPRICPRANSADGLTSTNNTPGERAKSWRASSVRINAGCFFRASSSLQACPPPPSPEKGLALLVPNMSPPRFAPLSAVLDEPEAETEERSAEDLGREESAVPRFATPT